MNEIEPHQNTSSENLRTLGKRGIQISKIKKKKSQQKIKTQNTGGFTKNNWEKEWNDSLRSKIMCLFFF